MAVDDFLDKPYHGISKYPCWSFTQIILRELGKPIPLGIDKMEQTDTPKIGDVVLLRSPEDPSVWHCGVLWPTTLKFVHCMHRPGQENKPPVGRLDRLSDQQFRTAIDGYYEYGGNNG